MKVDVQATKLARKRQAVGIKRLNKLFAYAPSDPIRPRQNGRKL
jgi:hypothetical protein